MTGALGRREMLAGLVIGPAIALTGGKAVAAAIAAQIDQRLPGVIVESNPGLARAVEGYRAEGAALLARISASTDPEQALMDVAKETVCGDCLFVGGWLLAPFDLVLLAARGAVR